MRLAITREKVLLFVLAIIMIGAENCFYLIDANSINVSGVFNYKDIFWVLSFLWIGYVMIVYYKYENPSFKYWPFILGIVILMIISSYQSQKLYGQPFMIGLVPQRYWLLYALLYFPLTKLLHNDLISTKQLFKIIKFIAICEIVLYSLQYLLVEHVTFLYVNTGERYGNSRFYFYNIFLRLFLMISINYFFYGIKMKKNLLLSIFVLFILIVVGKMRMTSLATLAALFIGIVIWRGNLKYKVYVFLSSFFIIIFLLNTEIVQDSLNTIINNSNGGTLAIRDIGRKWYLDGLSKNPILGCGYISILNENASIAAGIDQNIYMVDNGFWGFWFMYGGLGLIWMIMFFGTLVKDAWKLYAKKQVYFPLLFLLGLIIACNTELHWYWESGFLVLCLLFSMMPYLKKEDFY